MAKTKTPAALTIPKATQQVRQRVNKIMPGVMATVESAGSYDLEADVPLIVTTVTFPYQHPHREMLAAALSPLPDVRRIESEPARIVITRTR